MKRIASFLFTIATLVILGVTIVAVYTVRGGLPVLGTVILICVGGYFATGLLGLIIFFMRMLFHMTYHDVGPQGSYAQWFSRFIPLAPLTAPRPGVVVSEVEQVHIPTVAELLSSGAIMTGNIVLGIRPEDGSIRYGSWDDLRSFIVAGISRMGKTCTLFFFILQALIHGYRVTVCDPGPQKKTSITRLLEPLSDCVTFARTRSQVAAAVTEFGHRMRAADSESDTNELLVIDDWQTVTQDTALYSWVGWIIEEVNRVGSGLHYHLILSGQQWQPSRSGGNVITGSIHATIVHRLDPGQSRYLLGSGDRLRTRKLDVGHALLSDTTGEVEHLIEPLGVPSDAVMVRRMIKVNNQVALAAPEPVKEITPPKSEEIDTPLKTQLELALEHYNRGAKGRDSLAKSMGITPHHASHLLTALRATGSISQEGKYE